MVKSYADFEKTSQNNRPKFAGFKKRRNSCKFRWCFKIKRSHP